jgi:hypothetical protein
VGSGDDTIVCVLCTDANSHSLAPREIFSADGKIQDALLPH